MGQDTLYSKQTSIHFIVKNISPQKKRLTIFTAPIEYGASKDLLSIPEISEDMIRASLIKGELANKIRRGALEIVSTSIDLLQFDAEQKQFLIDAGADLGVQQTAEQIFYNDYKAAPPIGTNNVQDSIDFIIQRINLPFSTPNKFTVGSGGPVDFHTVHEAIQAAIDNGVSPLNPYEIQINIGSYVEPPMIVPAGLEIVGNHIPQSQIIKIIASNPNEDLFTMQGGDIEGVHVEGVTDPQKCLIRVDGYGQVAIYSISLSNCSNGIIVQNGGKADIKDCSVDIFEPNNAIGTAIYVTGTNTHVHIIDSYFEVDPVILSSYVGDPLTTCLSVHDNAKLFISNTICHINFNTSNSDVLFIDSGAHAFVLSCFIGQSNTVLHVGPLGSNTTVVSAGLVLDSNVLDGKIESSTARVQTINSTDMVKLIATAGASITGIVQDRSVDATNLIGQINYQYNTGKVAVLSQYLGDNTSTGLAHVTIPNGDVTDAGGLFVNVGSGRGWIQREGIYQDTFNVSWGAANNVALTASSTNYIVYDSATMNIKSILSPPTIEQILLATAVTDNSKIRFLHNTKGVTGNMAERVNTYISSTRRVVWNAGLSSTIGSTTRNIRVNSGSYFISLVQTNVAGYVGDAPFSYFYGSNGASEIINQTQVDITNYDSNGVLTTMTDGYYRVDTLYITSDNRLSLIYGTSQVESQSDGYAIGKLPPMNFIIDSACSVARVLVQKNVGIISVIDARPIANIAAITTGGSGATFHSALLGLTEDDHPQYLLESGARPMNGSLDMNSNSIINVTLVDGVDVSSHASRHNPGGLDSLAVGVPTATLIGASPSQGSAASYALSDHQHGISVGTPVAIGAANSAGTASSAVRSDHVHAHGNQTDGYMHAAVIASGANGFMTGADKAKLDGIAAGATNSPLTNVAPVNITKSAAAIGVATTAARSDHKHDITTAAPVSLGTANAEGVSTSLARADHVHAAPSSNIVESSTPITTTSATDVLMTGMSITPAAGTYLVWFNGDVSHNLAGASVFTNIYAGGVLQTSSERIFTRGNQIMSASFSCMARVTVNGSQAITGNWRTDNPTATNTHRSLAIILVS